MKISLSTLIGILLIGGAIALHFSRLKQAEAEQPTASKPLQVYSRQELKSLAPATDFSTSSQAYLQAEELVHSHQKKPAGERHQALLQALALLYRIQREEPAWKTELISKRIEQTIIALLDVQRSG